MPLPSDVDVGPAVAEPEGFENVHTARGRSDLRADEQSEVTFDRFVIVISPTVMTKN